jgi:hypothetical protein
MINFVIMGALFVSFISCSSRRFAQTIENENPLIVRVGGAGADRSK